MQETATPPRRSPFRRSTDRPNPQTGGMARTWLSIRVDPIEGQGERLWPRPGHVFAAARHTRSWRSRTRSTPLGSRDHLEITSPADAPAASIEPRLALLEKRRHTLTRVGSLARGGHELDRVGIGLALVEIDLGVEPLLAQRLRALATPRGPAQEF